jgi:putative ABC transport system permease protein
LDAEVSGGMKPGGSAPITKGLVVIALLILVIACINYINLSTARSAERAKEVGIRKVLGSHKRQLIHQFLTESYLLSFSSILVSIGLVFYLLPLFNRLIGADISFVFDIPTIAILFGSLLFIGLLSGLFPAFVLSGFNPSRVLKGNYTSSLKGKWVRSGLVVFQFWITTTLIISTLVLYKQINFMHEKDLGYKEDLLLVIEGAFDMDPNSTQPFLDEISKLHGVKGTAGTLWVQGFQGVWSDEYKTVESSRLQKTNRVLVGDEYLQLLENQLLEGSLFSKEAIDKNYVILNESAARGFGFKEPVGKKLVQVTNDGEEIPFTVKGIIKDFHYESLQREIAPLVIQSNEVSNGRMSYIAVRVSDGQVHETLSLIEAKWNQMVPDKAFNYRFMDNVVAAGYKYEEKLGLIFSAFSGLCIIISIIGLFAISGYNIRQRMKEISIRKVAGASAKDIILLLGTSFFKMIIAAFLLSAPLAWYIATLWLQNYAYKVGLSFGIFLIGGFIMIVVALLSISVNTLKAATANPVKYLNKE